METSTLGEASGATARARQIAWILKVILFNVYLTALGVMLVLMIPIRANFTPIRAEIMNVGPDDIARFTANLRDERISPHGPMWDVPLPMTVSTNAEGFRDRDHAIEHPPGVVRIALFGDSFIFGLSLEQKETLSSQLDAMLNADGRSRYEVFNFGIPGLNLEGMGKVTQVLGLKYRPDIAMYSFICDDISTIDSTSIRDWNRTLAGFPVVHWFLNLAPRTLVVLKMARYTMDYRFITTFPTLYRKRIKLVLDYLNQLAQQNGHDIVIIRYCGDTRFDRAVDEFNAARHARIEVLRDFPVELNPHDFHPTAACNSEVSRRLVDVVHRIEARRAVAR